MNPVVLKDDNVAAMEIWFKVLHKLENKDSYGVPISIVRQLVSAADKYFFDIRSVYGWFKGWYKQWRTSSPSGINIAALREMLYPTWRLNHARGFANITETLAYYDVGHITEARPDGDDLHLHLPSRIIRKGQAACIRVLTNCEQSN